MPNVTTIEYFASGLWRDRTGDPPACVNYAALLGVAANQSLVAAVTGKSIRVVSLTVSADGAGAGTLSLKNGSGGTVRYITHTPPNTVAPHKENFSPHGFITTDSGVGLFADVTVVGCYLTFGYIIYTP